MSTRRVPTLDELLAQLRRVPLAAQRLDDAENEVEKIYGVCYPSGGGIVVNEAACVVETVLHEALHALRPTWKEATVDARARQLFLRLTNDDINRVFRTYRRRARRERRKRVL